MTLDLLFSPDLSTVSPSASRLQHAVTLISPAKAPSLAFHNTQSPFLSLLLQSPHLTSFPNRVPPATQTNTLHAHVSRPTPPHLTRPPPPKPGTPPRFRSRSVHGIPRLSVTTTTTTALGRRSHEPRKLLDPQEEGDCGEIYGSLSGVSGSMS